VFTTSAGPVEIRSQQIVWLTGSEARLRDGRLIRGVLETDEVRTETPLGLLAVKVDELRLFIAAKATLTGYQRAAADATRGADAGPGEDAGGAGAPPAAVAEDPGGAARPSVVPSSGGASMRRERRFVVIVRESALYRDAVAIAGRVGRVVQGQLLTYIDSIDRRLRVLNTLVFDGGHWVKIRAADGTMGWLPAEAVREVR
jgi:hypothetical protein